MGKCSYSMYIENKKGYLLYVEKIFLSICGTVREMIPKTETVRAMNLTPVDI